MDPVNEPFDRPYTLSGFLSATERTRLAQALRALLGTRFVLEDEHGQTWLSGEIPTAQAHAVDIVHEFDTIGRLRADSELEKVQAAVSMLQILIAAAARDRMTSELHLHTTQESYRTLVTQHAALEQSEARYRELSSQLEVRVQEQVGVIERAQSQLFQAEKMASVGQLAAGMAHEINNPIGFIHSNLVTAQDYVRSLSRLASLVQKQNDSELAAIWQSADLDFVLEDFAVLLNESISGAQRITRIVADLKAFSNIKSEGETLEDLNEALQIVARMAQTQVGDGVRIELDLTACPPLRCDIGKLNQVFLSLVQNASQAVQQEGVICLRSRLVAGEIQVDVQDNGCGMASDQLPRIFDHFYSTRAVGQGTGLGLTVSRDIVVAHGGRIDVVSQLGMGTTVSVFLPLNRTPSA